MKYFLLIIIILILSNKIIAQENYNILVSNNIFLKNRPATKPTTRPDKTNQEEQVYYYVLSGVIEQENIKIAFFESTKTKETIQVQKNDYIANNKIIEITIDKIQYEKQGSQRELFIGQQIKE